MKYRNNHKNNRSVDTGFATEHFKHKEEQGFSLSNYD